VLGSAACAAALLVTDAAMLRWLPAAGLPAVNFSRFHGLRGDAQTTAMWIAGIWLLVSPTEELISRGFLIDQWSIVLKGLKRAPLFTVVASALTFGAIHFYEGTTGVITNMIAGLWLGGLYLQQRRTLWAVIIAHGIVDTVAMLAFFYGWL
jgi:membrane protease YdiL (CAAX protease family)